MNQPASDPTVERLRAITEQWMERVWRQRQLNTIDELHAPDFVDRSPAGRDSGNTAYKAGIAELYRAFPDFYAVTEDLVIEPATGKVAVRWTATGTHAAPYLGVAATGKQIMFSGIEIIRVVEDRIVERWGEWDGIALLEQLGAI
ncbi:MAG TPA: ester cyclase [Herpetosiphonaceae bacterium]